MSSTTLGIVLAGAIVLVAILGFLIASLLREVKKLKVAQGKQMPLLYRSVQSILALSVLMRTRHYPFAAMAEEERKRYLTIAMEEAGIHVAALLSTRPTALDLLAHLRKMAGVKTVEELWETCRSMEPARFRDYLHGAREAGVLAPFVLNEMGEGELDMRATNRVISAIDDARSKPRDI